METQTEEKSLSLKEQLEQLEKVIEDYEKTLHLNKIEIKEVDLNIDRQTLLSMPAEDIYGLCIEWSSYSLALQKALNKHNSRFYWVESVLDKYLSEQSPHYKGYSFGERKAGVLSNDSYAKKLSQFKEKCKMIIDRNAFLTSKIDFMCKMAQSVASMKRGSKDGS